MAVLEIQTPRVFVPLLQPARYKGAHGGRGSGKSHHLAEALVEKAVLQPGLRWVCIREVQKSLAQSAKLLIEDKIQTLGVGKKFRVLDKGIETPGGGMFIFQGMQNHTADTIKSLEGFDGAWVEEAQNFSARSLKLLRPTIRKPKSELWFSWNPEDAESPVDKFLRGQTPLKNAIVVQANWKDNPWFPPELEDERLTDLERNPDEYDHIWEGAYLTISEALIFKNRVSVGEFTAPEGTRFYHGVDWGFANDPTAVIRCYIQDECLYIDYEAFGEQVELDDLEFLFAGGRASDGIEYPGIPNIRNWPLKADCSRPETISYMARKGFQISAAKKWAGSVEDGITHLKSFKRIVIHERCVNMAREARLYSYKVDRQTECILPLIVDAHNHGWDATRYSLDGVIQGRGGLGVWERLAQQS
jgi:phage terminase large subunit